MKKMTLKLMAALCLFFMMLPASANDLPDMRVMDVSWSPTNPVVGQTVTFKATIRNLGYGDTPTGVPIGVGFRINNTFLGAYFVRDYNGDITEMASGGIYTGTCTATWTASGSSFDIEAIVDDIDRFAESNETNNSRTEYGTVSPGLPDVVVTNILWTPVDPEFDDVVTIRATVKNQGTVATPSGVPVGVGLTVDGSFFDAFFVRDSSGNTVSLAPGQSYTGTFGLTWNADLGTTQLCAWVDDINRFTESNENNNQRCENVHVRFPEIEWQ